MECSPLLNISRTPTEARDYKFAKFINCLFRPINLLYLLTAKKNLEPCQKKKRQAIGLTVLFQKDHIDLYTEAYLRVLAKSIELVRIKKILEQIS